MDYDQLKLIVEEAVSGAIQRNWWFYLIILILSGGGALLGSYLKKKGENVATKEDIQEITKKVEDIRALYARQLEAHKASLQLSNQLKLAAGCRSIRRHILFGENSSLILEMKQRLDQRLRNVKRFGSKTAYILAQRPDRPFTKRFSWLLISGISQEKI